MALDNQIKLLFPKTFHLIEKIMNVLLQVEENKMIKFYLFKMPII